MITLRKGADRGHFNHGWLDTYHSFSFGDYYDPAHHHFRALRVINEDRVEPGQGFGMHGHRDMEIVTYVLSGELEHRYSLGNGEVLRPGEFQRMTAGTGIRHSEFNPSPSEPVHLYQIWLFPRQQGLTPSYEQRVVPAGSANQFRLVASPDGANGSLHIEQDANIYLAKVEAGKQVDWNLRDGRFGWLQVLRGQVSVGAHQLAAGDAVAVDHEPQLHATASQDAELMWFDLA